MGLAVKTYFYLALCVTLLWGVESRMINIEEDAGNTSDVLVKIFIKHSITDVNMKSEQDNGNTREEITHQLEQNTAVGVNPREHLEERNYVDSFPTDLVSHKRRSLLPVTLFEETYP